MRLSWILWWVVLVFELILFAGASAFLWMREIDASGAVQTVQLKLINIAILGVFMLLPFLIVQLIWLVINIIYSKKQKKNINEY
ncbi:DUF3923 family protein [Staphylococcus pasteuri]|uniref:DUF3923 family protein n=1 Tax=Staphylococcus pasteuri TaxID=45972 RepID=UPI000D349C2D|nr:DUF3923 family protein [Staphylococcus pasteuri]MCD9066713.1 DUF3923 family protein [Staphylococcus pasteuri]PTU85556.1 DUF3923 domain-containing protein [Staphylococcus pasteuri]WAE41925.1 DUF3923 family protein [Staphylococcus pasteuri]